MSSPTKANSNPFCTDRKMGCWAAPKDPDDENKTNKLTTTIRGDTHVSIIVLNFSNRGTNIPVPQNKADMNQKESEKVGIPHTSLSDNFTILCARRVIISGGTNFPKGKQMRIKKSVKKQIKNIP